MVLLAGSVMSAASPAAELFGDEGAARQALVHCVQQSLAGVTAALLACGLWLSAVLSSSKTSDAWYDGRALAESTKSMAWKYMMKAEPYGPTLTEDEANSLLCDDLKKVLTETRTHALPSASASGEQISDAMIAVRRLSPLKRLDVYLNGRIKDQRDWYAKRSGEHAASSRTWFAFAIGANVIAVLVSVAGILWLPANGIVGVATTAASCSVAWMQLQRFADLAHSYSFTSHEIGLLSPRAKTVSDDDTLARFVADCETAFSREHTMWRARREIADN